MKTEKIEKTLEEKKSGAPYSTTERVCSVPLYEYPSSITKPEELKGKTVVFGDMHGNSVKLLHHLIEKGIVSLPENDYLTFVAYYAQWEQPEDGLDLDHEIKIFNEMVISKMTVNKPEDFKLQLMGDLISDRGKNDLWTFMLLEELDKQKLDFSISLSNHDLEFFSTFEIGHGSMGYSSETASIFPLSGRYKGQYQYKEMNEIPHIANWVKLVLSKTQFIPYEIGADEDGMPIIHIFPHAPIYPVTIVDAAKELGLEVPEKIDTVGELAKLLDKMNNKVSQMLSSDNADERKNFLRKLVDGTALPKCIWQRENEKGLSQKTSLKEARGIISEQVNMINTYGHDSSDPTWAVYCVEQKIYTQVNRVNNHFGHPKIGSYFGLPTHPKHEKEKIITTSGAIRPTHVYHLDKSDKALSNITEKLTLKNTEGNSTNTFKK